MKYLLILTLAGCSNFQSVRESFFKNHTIDVINLANDHNKYVIDDAELSSAAKHDLVMRNNQIIENALLMYDESINLHKDQR